MRPPPIGAMRASKLCSLPSDVRSGYSMRCTSPLAIAWRIASMQRAAMSAGSSSSTRRPRTSLNGRASSGCRSSALSR